MHIASRTAPPAPQRRLRIGLIGHHVGPIAPPFCGGVESFTWNLAHWLARHGHDVVLFALPGSCVPGAEVRPLPALPAISEAARADVGMPPERFLAAHHAYLSLLLELGQEDEHFDVLHSCTLHYLPVAMAATLPAPMLMTLHTPPTAWLESALRAAAVPPKLTAVSRATAGAWGGIAERIDVVPNGVDVGAWPLGTGGAGAVWCGRIVPEKAPHLAIDAARAAGLPLRLAGPIIDRDFWRREVEPRLGPDAQHVGHLDHDELGALLGAADVLLVTPTWEEPYCLAAAEAMACGTPVAAFARGGLVDVVGTAGGRLARPGDVAGLARAARAAARQSRPAVRAYAARELSLDVTGAAYEARYHALARGRRRTRLEVVA